MEPRLCKDCRFALPPEPPRVMWKCLHPASLLQPELDLVTGETLESEPLFCGSARTTILPGRCGPSGQFWEPRGFV